MTHGAAVNFSGKLYNFVFYGTTSDGWIDYDDIAAKAKKYRPKLIVAGASCYSRIIDFERIAKIAQEVGAYFMADIAHIAGLVATNYHPSPFGFADIVTTTTHKTLRANRGALIFCKPELAKKVDRAVFPGSQGGPLEHCIVAKAVGAEEACTESFKTYIGNVVRNARAMAMEFRDLGYDIVTGGTDNHLMLIDFSKTHPDLTGKFVQDMLDEHYITLNKECVPGEKRSPVQTSGIRLGTPAMTTLGYGTKEFVDVARRIDGYIKQH